MALKYYEIYTCYYNHTFFYCPQKPFFVLFSFAPSILYGALLESCMYKENRIKLIKILIPVVLLLAVFLAVSCNSGIETVDVTQHAEPVSETVRHFTAEEKESLDAYAESLVDSGADFVKTNIASKIVSVGVKGASRSAQLAKDLWNGKYIDGYVADDSASVRTELAVPSGFELAKVVKVVDGDTLKCDLLVSNNESSSAHQTVDSAPYDEHLYYIRLLGINTPESDAALVSGYVDSDYDVSYGRRSSSLVKSILKEGTYVWLSCSPTAASDTDKYDRLLRLVWLVQPADGDRLSLDAVRYKTLNALIVSEGFAEAAPYDDKTYDSLFAELMSDAKENKRGLWSELSDMSREGVANR